jgi:ABC-type oligopeptide transport system substrate-binding subunit
LNKEFYITIAVIIIIVAGALWVTAGASKWHGGDTTVNNNFNDVTEITEVSTITTGVSDKDLAEGLATALAAGGHQFDYSTSDWQGSIVGSWESSEDENAVSFGLGKRFEKMDALLHTSYTQGGGEHYLTFGGTFRF